MPATVAPGRPPRNSATPIRMKTICAIISVVVSTTAEAKASALAMPRRISARTPIRMPPTCEKGSTSPAASRTMRPQTKVRNGAVGVSANHAAPRIRNVASA